MESPGQHLKAEREKRNLSLTEVAKSTRIQSNILHAIEEGRDDLLPHPFYLRAFLTTYAKYLGLHPTDVISRNQASLNVSSPAPTPMEPMCRIQSPRKLKVPWLLFSLSLAISLSFLFFYHFSDFSVDRDSQLSRKPLVPASSPAPSAVPSTQETQGEPETPPFIESTPGDVSEPTLLKESPPSFEIVEAAVGNELKTEGGFLKLTGTCVEFVCNSQKVYFLTRTNGKKEGKLTHVWSRRGTEFYRIEIDIKSPTRSVYSYFTLRPNHIGDWTVEARDGDSILQAIAFKGIPPDTHF